MFVLFVAIITEAPDDIWEAMVLVLGIILLVVCGGAVILRWICDFMNKFISSSQNRFSSRRHGANRHCSTISPSMTQSWYPGDLPPPYYEEQVVPGYDEVILSDILHLRLPPEPPPYCFEPPPGFDSSPDADEQSETVQTVSVTDHADAEIYPSSVNRLK